MPWQFYSGVLDPMVRGDRFLVLALGLFLAAPSYGQETKSNQTQNRKENASKLERIALAVERLPRATAQDGGCQPGQDNRHSDLCAQWKAADAASDAAYWAVLTWIAGMVGLALGIGTLVAAWRAAHWAKKAAEHTETAATAADGQLTFTKETTQRQMRPYVLIDEIKIVKSEQPEFGLLGFRVFCCLKNFGQTPALNMKMEVNGLHWHGSKLPPWWPFPDFPERWGPSDQKPNVLAPGQSAELLTTHISGDQVPEVQKGWRRVFVWGRVEYTDKFGKAYRTTFCRRIKIQRTESGPYCTAPFTEFYNCIDEQCETEEATREPIPDYVENFDSHTGIGPWEPFFWNLWLETQVPSTWERAPDGTPLDVKKRDYYGVIQPFRNG